MSQADSSSLEEGAVIGGRYSVMSLIDKGGFGAVFKARQISTGQLVAVKILHPERLRDAGKAVVETARFEREMQLIARLKHPNIVRLVDSGELEGGELFTVLEFIDGIPLSKVLEREGKLAPRESHRLMLQVIDALTSAHDQGIVHRDLKPGNIMVTSTGGLRNAIVLDFGIASMVEERRDVDFRTLTEEGSVRGTPAYMAPEQMRGEKVTPQSDLYAWGLVFLECLTGEAPFNLDSYAAIIFAQMSSDPVPLPRQLQAHPLGSILGRALAKDRRERYRSARDILIDLERCPPDGLTGEIDAVRIQAHSGLNSTTLDEGEVGVSSQSDPQRRRTQSEVLGTSSLDLPQSSAPRPRRGLWIALAVLALALVGSLGLWIGGRDGSSGSSETADAQATPATDTAPPATPPSPGTPDGPQAGDRPETPPAAPTAPALAVATRRVPAGGADLGLTTAQLDLYITSASDSANIFDLDHGAGVLRNENWQRPALDVMVTELTWQDLDKLDAEQRAAVDALCPDPMPQPGPPAHAAVRLGAAEAAAVCEALGMRLPTLREWEAIARGGAGKVYGFGGELDEARAAALREPGPAGRLEWNVNADGVRDLSGGVHEWVACPAELALPNCKDGFAYRGGSFASDALLWHTFVVPGPGAESLGCLRRDDVGVRCVREPP